METKFSTVVRMGAAFFAGQAVIIGMILLLRPATAQAQSDVLMARVVLIRGEPNGAGMQLSAQGASGGPSVSFFDAGGASRMQLSLDTQGKPTVVLRTKSGSVAIGIGLAAEDRPAIAVRNAKGDLVPLPLPEK